MRGLEGELGQGGGGCGARRGSLPPYSQLQTRLSAPGSHIHLHSTRTCTLPPPTPPLPTTNVHHPRPLPTTHTVSLHRVRPPGMATHHVGDDLCGSPARVRRPAWPQGIDARQGGLGQDKGPGGDGAAGGNVPLQVAANNEAVGARRAAHSVTQPQAVLAKAWHCQRAQSNLSIWGHGADDVPRLPAWATRSGCHNKQEQRENSWL
jgi:hypothetical protein